MDSDRIRRRIRALLNLAGDAGAADGEIDNAMRAAAALMEEHHISREDIEAEAAAAREAGAPVSPVVENGSSETAMGSNRLCQWESVLAWAVRTLVGSVQHCHGHTRVSAATGSIFDGMGARTEGRRSVVFYGPAEDAVLAADLFSEWRHVITTMAVGGFGGCYRGDGAMYAYGFASRLLERASEAEKARYLRPATSAALVLAGAPQTLGAALERRREGAAEWLRGQGVRLRSGGGGGGGYRSGSREAFAAGRAAGDRAEFSAARRKKLS